MAAVDIAAAERTAQEKDFTHDGLHQDRIKDQE